MLEKETHYSVLYSISDSRLPHFVRIEKEMGSPIFVIRRRSRLLLTAEMPDEEVKQTPKAARNIPQLKHGF